jgi:N-acetylmuramoyl-L-alanine amidase
MLKKIRENAAGIKQWLISLTLLTAFSLTTILASYISFICGPDHKAYINVLNTLSSVSTVVIDAGHGGEDPGTIGVNGAYEKDINLSIAITLGELLTERGFAVVYTRTDDRMLYGEGQNIKGIRKISDLKNRCKIAAEYPQAIFVSIHMNSYGSPAFSGLHVYYSPEDENSKLLANKIQYSVKENLQNTNNRKIKPGKDIYVLENVENTAVLIECGFLTNAEECEKLSQKEYQKQLCLAIVCGIIEYKEKISTN